MLGRKRRQQAHRLVDRAATGRLDLLADHALDQGIDHWPQLVVRE
jgi:hypothetical protein